MGYHLEDTVELVKYHQIAEGIEMGSGICEENADTVKFASNKIKEGIANQSPKEVILGSCQAVFDSLSAMHAMGYDLNEFDSVFRTYVDFRFRNIRDWTEDKPDFKYDIPAECVFDTEWSKETVKGPYHKDNLPDFDDLIGNVIAKRKESET